MRGRYATLRVNGHRRWRWVAAIATVVFVACAAVCDWLYLALPLVTDDGDAHAVRLGHVPNPSRRFCSQVCLLQLSSMAQPGTVPALTSS
jgi:hypothetical protein